MRVGADTGGTFTDLVTEDGGVAKVLSTPHDPGRALREGIAAAIAGNVPAERFEDWLETLIPPLRAAGPRTSLLTGLGEGQPVANVRSQKVTLATSERVQTLLAAARRVEESGIPIDDLSRTPRACLARHR